MFFGVGGQFSCHCFLKGLSFPLCTFLAWFSWTVHIHVALFLGALFFPRVAVPVFVSSLLWLLQLRDVVWSQRGRCLQVHSSFSESFGLFRVLSCCRILLGIFIFLWKIPLDIMSTVHLLMALVGMDILITHFSSARAWTIFLFICIFFGFFISAF